MGRPAKFFLLVLAPALAVLLAWLGLKTLQTNLLGWFLMLTGLAYVFGMVIVFFVRREGFWDSQLGGKAVEEEHKDYSFWLIALAMAAVFYLSPLEYLYFSAILMRKAWMPIAGVALVALGTGLFIWARRTLGANYSGHVSVRSDQKLVQSGPYRFIRHPAYLGYLGMALGISLGYSSIAGVGAIVVLFLPSLVYRINVEERLLSKYFGESYRTYADTSKKIIPGIW